LFPFCPIETEVKPGAGHRGKVRNIPPDSEVIKKNSTCPPYLPGLVKLPTVIVKNRISPNIPC